MAEPRRKLQLLSTLFAVLGGAFGFATAALNFYERSQPAQVKVFINGFGDYTAPSEKACGFPNLEVILLPLSFVNEGAKSGVVTNLRLEIKPTGSNQRRTFVARAIGIPDPAICYKGLRPLAPLTVLPAQAVSESIVFYSEDNATDPILRRNSRTQYEISLVVDQIVGRADWDSRPTLATRRYGPLRLTHGLFANEHAERDRIGLKLEPMVTQ